MKARPVSFECPKQTKARTLLRKYADKDFSLTDATSFLVMDRLSIVEAFTFDSAFAQYGTKVLSA